MSNDDTAYIGHLFEQVMGEIKAVHELVAAQPTRAELNELRVDVEHLTQDTRVLNAGIADLSQEVRGIRLDLTEHTGGPAHDHKGGPIRFVRPAPRPR